MKIGFIGLGSLGSPIATNILESGHTLHVFNRTLSKAKPLADKGAIVSESISALANACDIIFSIVSDDAAVKDISETENGLVKNMKPESIHVSMSTILPKTAAYLSALHEKHGSHYLASPIFGRPEAVAARKANFVISGKEDIRNKIEPLLKNAGGAAVWHFGDNITAANTVKLCGNFLIAGAMEAIGESIYLANESGVDAQKMWAMFLQTLFNAPVYHNYGGVILQEKYDPAAFTVKLGLKDMNLVLAQADAVNQPMPLAKLLQSNMQQLVDTGQDQTDWAAVSTVVKKKG
ncbi:MAG: NAD(P)-dependent oxidoreductase [Bacteroidetes bacterium]|nr:NAD(P)-dependent oxidoreductase [Bacteroidota bacterium]